MQAAAHQLEIDACPRSTILCMTATSPSRPAGGSYIERRSTSPPCWPAKRLALGSRRRHLNRQLYELRSRIYRTGTENPATHRQPVRPVVVTYVLGTFCYPCVRVGQEENWSGRTDLNRRPSRWQRDALPLSYARIQVLGYIATANAAATARCMAESCGQCKRCHLRSHFHFSEGLARARVLGFLGARNLSHPDGDLT